MSSAGWYNDPAGSGELRYFDGVNWTDQLKSHVTNENPQASTEEVGDIFSNNQNVEINGSKENQSTDYSNKFTSPVNSQKNTEDDFSALKALDNVKAKKSKSSSSKRKNAETYAKDRSYISKVVSISKKILVVGLLLVIVIGFVGQFSKGKDDNSNGDLGKVSNPITGKEVDQKEVIKEESEANLPIGGTSSKELENSTKLPTNAEALLKSSIETLSQSTLKNGVRITRKSDNKILEIMLNPNGSVKIIGDKGTGYGDGKYLYLPKSLILDIENDKDTLSLFQTQGKSIIRMTQNNGQIGSTLFSAKYYDGANFPKFYDNLKDDISRVDKREEGSLTVLEVTTSGGNDWFKLYLENGIIKKVLIDEGSSYEVAMSFEFPGKAKIIIPKSGYIKF